MQVIKEGRKQRGWAKEFTCTGRGNGMGGCSAVLLVEARDLFQTSTSCRDEITAYITFECMSCGVWTDLINADLPPGIWNTAKPRYPSERGPTVLNGK